MKRIWTEKMTRRLRRNYPSHPDLNALAETLGVSYAALKNKAQKLHLHRTTRKRWKPSEEKRLRRLYPDTSNKELAQRFHCTVHAVENVASRLNLKKSHDYLAERGRENCRHPNIVANQFKKGSVPKNKGKKEWQFRSEEGIAKCAQTQFKAGHTPHNTKPDGYESVHKDGYVYIKAPGTRKMQPKHRYVWQLHNGPIPPGHCIAFRDGNRANCDISNLILITESEKARRVTAAMTPEQRRERIEKAMATQRENIRKDKMRIRWGLPPKTRRVKQWYQPQQPSQ